MNHRVKADCAALHQKGLTVCQIVAYLSELRGRRVPYSTVYMSLKNMGETPRTELKRHPLPPLREPRWWAVIAQKVVALHRQGKSTGEIAALLGCHRNYPAVALRRCGITPRRKR